MDNILNQIDMGQIATPEIQRPFVWKSTKVCDLIDSLYKGYPVGYIVTWQNPNARLKDGSSSTGKTIIIDGQQRITSLETALMGRTVVNDDYDRVVVKIAFNPLDERFETCTPAIERSPEWIPDISKIMMPGFSMYTFMAEYLKHNGDKITADELSHRLQSLQEIKTRQIGELRIKDSVDIETVNDIFTRINSKGTKLTEADFAMSKIAIYEHSVGDEYGMMLRKQIDYYCEILANPRAYDNIVRNDKVFADSDRCRKIKWTAHPNDKLRLIYKPLYGDLIRVAGIVGLGRARMRDVVALLSGRDFTVRSFNDPNSYKDEIADKSFDAFSDVIDRITNETAYAEFEQDILAACGFPVLPCLIRRIY